MVAPVNHQPIPAQIINERAAYGPFDLKEFIAATHEQPIQFSASLNTGQSLPKGLICTADGILTGIPAKGTAGNYEFLIEAENPDGKIQVPIVFTIKPGVSVDDAEYIDKIKSQVWQALEQNLPIPDLGEMFEREITPLDIYYLLERWSILTIWDAFNLEPPGEKKIITLAGASPHYNVYDRGSCLVGSPKDLYSYERTIEDGLMTARAMAREAYNRNWTIELVGFDKLRRAAWIELQLLGDQKGKKLEVVNYNPSIEDVKLYTNQAIETSMRGKLE